MRQHVDVCYADSTMSDRSNTDTQLDMQSRHARVLDMYLARGEGK